MKPSASFFAGSPLVDENGILVGIASFSIFNEVINNKYREKKDTNGLSSNFSAVEVLFYKNYAYLKNRIGKLFNGNKINLCLFLVEQFLRFPRRLYSSLRPRKMDFGYNELWP